MCNEYKVPQLSREDYEACRNRVNHFKLERSKVESACMECNCYGIECKDCAFSSENYEKWKALSKGNRIRHILI